MTNRFERGFIPPQPIDRRTSGGVDVVAATATRKETDLLPLAGALVNVSTTENTALDPGWSNTSSYFIRPSGQALSRSTYSSLFNRIGTTWGSGDGSSTFNSVNILQPNRPPYAVSVAPTTYTTVGAYGSGNFIDHPHRITAGNQQTWLYNAPAGTGNDQRGNYSASSTPGLSGLFTGSDNIQPNSTSIRSYLCYEDSTLSLPLGYVIAHITPIASISSVLTQYPKVLVASGQTISAATYPDYVAAYGTVLPDLQGRFLRQDCHNVNIPAGSNTGNLGTTQAIHSHRWTGTPMNVYGIYTQTPRFRNGTPSPSGAYFGPTNGTPYTLGPGNETRPYNTSVTYLIKVLP